MLIIGGLAQDFFYPILLRFINSQIIQYSCLSVFVSACACVHDNSKNDGSIHLKLEHIVAYGNSLEEFDLYQLGYCRAGCAPSIFVTQEDIVTRWP